MTLYEVELAERAAVPLAVVRRLARGSELSKLVPEGCGIVWNAVRAAKVQAGRNVALYRDSAINLEVGVEMPGDFADTGEVVRSATPAGLVASTTHIGPYGGLGAAHQAIHDWSARHGHKLAGPRWEIYGHWLPEWNDDPSRIRTDVYYLMASGPDH